MKDIQAFLHGCKCYDITDFGAYPSDILMTEPIQKAIDTCHVNGGGIVRIPAGTFRTGGLDLRSGVCLHLLSGAELEGSRNPADYSGPERRWMHALIKAYDSTDIGIIGEPFSRLNGMNCYDPDGEEKYRGPHGVLLKNCSHILLSGYTIRDCGNWGHAIFSCSDLCLQNVAVFGGHDGIDIHCCTATTIESCDIHTGDDAIAGFGNEHCVIRDCVLDSSCSAMRFGGYDCLFERCRIPHPKTYGFRGVLPMEAKKLSLNDGSHTRHGSHALFTYYCDRRWELSQHNPGNITFRDCDIDHPGQIICLDFNGRNQWCCYRPLSDVTFERCTIRGIEQHMHIHGDPDTPVTITFRDCTLAAAPEASDKAVANAFNFNAIHFENTTIEGYDTPTIITRSQGNVTVKNSTTLACSYQPNPADIIFTLDEIREKIAALPADIDAWRQWSDSMPAPSEEDWNPEYGLYRPQGCKLGNDSWSSVLAVLRGTTTHAARIARSCVAHYGYFCTRNGLICRDYGVPDAKPSALPVGAYAYTMFLDTPITARALLTDFLRSSSCPPAAVAGIAEALKKM